MGGGDSPEILSATVPAEIPLQLDLEGTVTVPDNLFIVNNVDTRDITVQSIDVTLKDPWQAADFDDDFTQKEIDSTYFSIKLRKDKLNSEGLLEILDPTDWNIPASDRLDLQVDAKLSRQSQASDKQGVATISFNLDWASGSTEPEEPDNTRTVTVEKADNCTITDEYIQTDKNGQITTLPEVLPDEGYEFKGWETTDGIPVDIGDILDSDITIRPIIEPIPVTDITISFAIQGNGKFSVTTPNQPETVEKGIRFSELNKPKPIPTSNSYMFDKWVDADGNEITDNTYLEKDTTLTAVFKADTAVGVGLNMDNAALVGYDPNDGSDTWYVKERYIQNGTEYKITSIDYARFEGKKKIVLPYTLESIQYAKLYCPGTEEIVLPLFLNSFAGGSIQMAGGIEKLTIDPDNAVYTDVDNILYTKDMKKLVYWAPAKPEAELDIPSSVESIGDRAFEGAKNIKIVNANSSLRVVGGYTFYGTGIEEFNFVPGINKIGGSAFIGCVKLKSINLPDTLEVISGSAFTNSGLTSINIPSSVTTLGAGAFSGCKNLTTVTIQYGLKQIGGTSVNNFGAFEDCTSLTSVSIPSSVKTIGTYTFQGCTKLYLTVPSTVTSILDSAFKNVPQVRYSGSASGSPWGAKSVVKG